MDIINYLIPLFLVGCLANIVLLMFTFNYFIDALILSLGKKIDLSNLNSQDINQILTYSCIILVLQSWVACYNFVSYYIKNPK